MATAPFTPARKHLVAIDSDGCAIDSMEWKHREAFGPALIDIWGLESIRQTAMELWLFVNLYSASRGLNRFKALVRFFELLPSRVGSEKGDFGCPGIERLADWTASAQTLSASALAAFHADHPHPELEKALAWSGEVSRRVEVGGARSGFFPSAVEAFRAMRTEVDLIVVSSADRATLEFEWSRSGLDTDMRWLASQEAGTKAACLRQAVALGYDPERVLMIGDAPSDAEAADAAGIAFYPVLPGRENESWRSLRDEFFPVFLRGTYRGTVEASLRAAHAACLPPTV